MFALTIATFTFTFTLHLHLQYKNNHPKLTSRQEC